MIEEEIQKQGVVGDYDDFNDVEELIDIIRTGNK